MIFFKIIWIFCRLLKYVYNGLKIEYNMELKLIRVFKIFMVKKIWKAPLKMYHHSSKWRVLNIMFFFFFIKVYNYLNIMY